MDYLGEVGRGERLEKWEVALTGAQRYGWLLILDVRAGRDTVVFVRCFFSELMVLSARVGGGTWIVFF